MKLVDTKAALYAGLLARMAMAATDPPTDGGILACHGQGCDDCPVAASVNEGFPNCIAYQSADALGESYASSSGNGYDVWWDSGPANPTCKIIIRTPASTDLPACGYYLTSWSDAGCYYTAIQQSFMAQFCCGTGDCDAASPAANMEDALAQASAGNTTVVHISLENMGASGTSGKRSVEGIGEMSWRRSDHAYAKREESTEKVDNVRNKVQQRDDCIFHPTSDLVTEGGEQSKASDTQVCNTQGGCALSAAVTVTVGQSINPTLTANLFSVISAAVGYTFTESTAYSVTTTYTQKQGTTGYMSYIPTLDCFMGTFSNCYQTTGDNIQLIDPNQSFYACTPALRSGGQLDGTFSFVYSN